MAKIKLIHGDSAQHNATADLILTDPPFEMCGKELGAILDRYNADHLVMLTTMRQLLQLAAARPEWMLAFDFVFDGVAPKKSKSNQQPNYLHQTGVYMTKNGAKSRFNRKLRQRSDVFEGNGYWPTIMRAPRVNMQAFGQAKNGDAWTDLLGSFDVSSVVDPFAGIGTTAHAVIALEDNAHDIEATLIERDENRAAHIKQTFRFFGLNLDD